jgi:hypothetical protein
VFGCLTSPSYSPCLGAVLPQPGYQGIAKLVGVSGLGQQGATNVAETVDLSAEALAEEDALTRLIQSLRPSP